MKIGLRTIKTFIAVLLSLGIYLLLYLLNFACGIYETPRNLSTMTELWYAPTNFYTPFFASIAAVYAMHRNILESRKQAKIRSIGSVIGGYYGFIIIAVFEWITLDLIGMENGTIYYNLALYTVVSVGIIFLIALTVKWKFTLATFVSCLTYLSVTVSIRNGGMNPFLFATNRILSTVIGVLIALFVNTFPHHFIKNRNILFVSSLDNAMLNAKHELSNYMEYKLNSLTAEKCNFTFMTTRAMTSLRSIFKNVELQRPIVVMTGCAVYDPVTKKYDRIVSIDKKLRSEAEELFKRHNVCVFSYLINNHTLHCYYNDIKGVGAETYYQKRKESSSYSFVQADVPQKLDIEQYVIIDEDKKIEQIIEEFKTLPTASEFNVISYPFQGMRGYSFLKINYKDALKEKALEKLKHNDLFTICFGSGHTDIEAMKEADFSFCLGNAPLYVKDVADYIIQSDEPDEIVKYIARIFHKKNYKKYLEKLKADSAAF